jgi:hypothetical protein
MPEQPLPTYKERLTHLAALVRRMREQQKRFYDSKDFIDLRRAKKLEREVDDLLREEEQPTLWEPEDE